MIALLTTKERLTTDDIAGTSVGRDAKSESPSAVADGDGVEIGL